MRKEKIRMHQTALFLFVIFGMLTGGLILGQSPAPAPREGQAGETAIEEPAPPSPALSQSEISKIEAFISKQMQLGKIPGMAVAIVRGNQTVYKKGFGVADVEKKTPVTEKTFFELASCSKAYTGLAILRLESEGKLKLSDTVDQYLPWFKMKYKGQETKITLTQLVYQKSGIPYYEALSDIPPSQGDNALEEGVRRFMKRELVFKPGRRYAYSTVNYALLGLVIQEVSGKPYETYMRENLLEPLGLTSTFLFRADVKDQELARGYKLSFSQPVPYDAPMYRGNTPAAYIITNIEDWARWLRLQAGAPHLADDWKQLVKKSHVADLLLTNSNYAAGWFVFPHLGIITHDGANPNYSSFIGFQNDGTGVVVLANIASGYTTGVGRGVLAVLKGMEPKQSRYDRNMQFDNLSVRALYVAGILLLISLVLLSRSLVKLALKQKRYGGVTGKKIVGVVIATVLLAALSYLLLSVPALFGSNVSLWFSLVWMPMTFTYAVMAIFFSGFFFYLSFLGFLFFPKVKDQAAKVSNSKKKD